MVALHRNSGPNAHRTSQAWNNGAKEGTCKKSRSGQKFYYAFPTCIESNKSARLNAIVDNVLERFSACFSTVQSSVNLVLLSL